MDFESSTEQHRTVVLDGIDESLDNLKRTYDGIDDLLSTTARTIETVIPHQIKLDLNVIFFPQIGFLITLPLDKATGRGIYEGEAEAEPWERMFTTDNRGYYKDFRMREMDETFGDMYASICGKLLDLGKR